jgi:hypothetical protein
MKKTSILIAFIVITISSCKRTITNGPQINYQSENVNQGTITLDVSGSGEDDKTLFSGKNILENIASKRAFEQLLFIGIPGSSAYRVPLTPNMDRSTESNPFLKAFFTSSDFRRFITSISPITNVERASNYRNTIRYRITINGQAFRKYLEEKGQIRSFGY